MYVAMVMVVLGGAVELEERDRCTDGLLRVGDGYLSHINLMCCESSLFL